MQVSSTSESHHWFYDLWRDIDEDDELYRAIKADSPELPLMDDATQRVKLQE